LKENRIWIFHPNLKFQYNSWKGIISRKIKIRAFKIIIRTWNFLFEVGKFYYKKYRFSAKLYKSVIWDFKINLFLLTKSNMTIKGSSCLLQSLSFSASITLQIRYWFNYRTKYIILAAIHICFYLLIIDLILRNNI